MPQRIDARGHKYGRLTVIEFKYYNKHKQPMWEVICDCGNIKVVNLYNLRCGDVVSCGCYLKEKISSVNRLPDGEAAFRRTYQNYKKSAKWRKLNFNLTQEEFRKIAEQNCHYCNIKPYHEYKSDSNTGTWKANGIDRLDSSKGYFIDNVVPCCWICNDMKKNASLEEFKKRIKTIYEHLNL